MIQSPQSKELLISSRVDYPLTHHLNQPAARLLEDVLSYVCVDVETSGPTPADYALLSIGACLVADPETQFYIELQPDTENVDPNALEVSGLSMNDLAETGTPVKIALEQFEEWIKTAVPAGKKPLFVAFNAPFDWMFVNQYFHRYLGHNPFGHAGLDIKAYYMGFKGVPWSETSFPRISALYSGREELLHNALQDAIDQAVLFKQILNEVVEQKRGGE